MASKPDDLERTLAPLLVGGVLSCISSGLVLSLATTYFTRFNQDASWIKVSIFVLTILSFVGSGVDTSWVYSWTVTHFMSPSALDHTPWELAAYHFLNGLVVVIVQAFYLWRSWLTSGRSKGFLGFAVVPVSIVSAACFGLSMYMTALLLIGGPHDIHFDRLREVSYGWYSGVLSVDLFIFVTMLNHLVYRPRILGTTNSTKSSSGEIARRDELRQATRWRTLSARVFHTNSISLAVQAVVLAFFVARSNGLQYIVFALFSPKIYIISLLATFNSRSPHGNGALDPIETFTLERFKTRHIEAPVHVVVEHETLDEIGEDEDDFDGRKGRIDLNGTSEVGKYQVTFDKLRGEKRGGETTEFEMAKFA